ncbi:GAF domain-containing protein [Balneolaceae bacterium ANBcel3]|nr:GAF domain-containing protein [Balneolaceae bacterium ANBcel3]
MNLNTGSDREKEYRVSYKKMIRDILVMLRASLQAETVAMHWINNQKEVFVLEHFSTTQKKVVFEDRVEKNKHYLGKYDAIKSVTLLEVGAHLQAEDLDHHTGESSVEFIYLIPFVYDSETVAVTSVEMLEKKMLSDQDIHIIQAYEKVIFRLLKAYLELSDLTEKQSEWIDYEQVVEGVCKTSSPIELVLYVLKSLDTFVRPYGGCSLMARGMNEWHTVLYPESGAYPPPVGLVVMDGSLSARALDTGEPVFSSHLNANPKRIAPNEPLSYGASLVVPVMHHQRRQLMILVYHENPLLFSEALKHKISNLCRIAGLKLESMLPGLDVGEDIFSTSVTSFRKELFVAVMERLLKHIESPEAKTAYNVWMGMVSVGNLADLRTRYRLDELRDLQKEIVLHLAPSRYELPGIIGEHSDYVYSFVIQSPDESAFRKWTERVRDVFEKPVLFGGGNSEKIQLHVGCKVIKEPQDPNTVTQTVRSAMNEAVNRNMFLKEA